MKKGLRDKTTLNLQNESDGSSRDPDEEVNDCLKDRKNALEDKSVSFEVKKKNRGKRSLFLIICRKL